MGELTSLFKSGAQGPLSMLPTASSGLSPSALSSALSSNPAFAGIDPSQVVAASPQGKPPSSGGGFMGPLSMAAGAAATAMGQPQLGIPLMMGGFSSTAGGSSNPTMQSAGQGVGQMGQSVGAMAPALQAMGMGGQKPQPPPQQPQMQAPPPRPQMPPQQQPQMGMGQPSPAPPPPGGQMGAIGARPSPMSNPQTAQSMSPMMRAMMGLG